MGADDGGPVAATMNAPSLPTDNLSGGAEAGDSITGTSLNSGGAEAGGFRAGAQTSDLSLNSGGAEAGGFRAGASTSDSGLNSGSSDQVISSLADNAGRSSLEQNELKDSVETPVPVQKVVAKTRDNLSLIHI